MVSVAAFNKSFEVGEGAYPSSGRSPPAAHGTATSCPPPGAPGARRRLLLRCHARAMPRTPGDQASGSSLTPRFASGCVPRPKGPPSPGAFVAPLPRSTTPVPALEEADPRFCTGPPALQPVECRRCLSVRLFLPSLFPRTNAVARTTPAQHHLPVTNDEVHVFAWAHAQ